MGRMEQNCKQCGRIIYFEGICVFCREENERNRILALPQEEIDAAVQEICDEIDKTGELDEKYGLFKKLLDYRDIDTSQIAETAFQKGVFHPGELYKEAPDDVIKAMLDMLMQDDIDSMLANNLQRCLAVHGGEEVFQSFLELESHPREWRKKLHANPSVYATEGGWSYDSSGQFMKTNFDKCYPIVKGTLEEKKHSPVKICAKTDEKCPKCGGRMVNLMEIDGRDPRLDFLEIDGVIKAKCCLNCLPFSDGDFCRYTVDGESEIILGDEHTCAEDYLEDEEAEEDEWVEELDSNSYILGSTSVPPRYAADWEGGSSIGGFAFWIQDCDIKLCPDCGKPMKYLAQIQWDTLDYMEGNGYLEICKECRVIAMLHQQT